MACESIVSRTFECVIRSRLQANQFLLRWVSLVGTGEVLRRTNVYDEILEFLGFDSRLKAPSHFRLGHLRQAMLKGLQACIFGNAFIFLHLEVDCI